MPLDILIYIEQLSTHFQKCSLEYVIEIGNFIEDADVQTELANYINEIWICCEKGIECKLIESNEIVNYINSKNIINPLQKITECHKLILDLWYEVDSSLEESIVGYSTVYRSSPANKKEHLARLYKLFNDHKDKYHKSLTPQDKSDASFAACEAGVTIFNTLYS